MLDEILSRDKASPVIVLAVIAAVLITGAGVASAAVSGSFSSTYDGWNDGSNTDPTGHEIQTTGTIEFTGDSAVNPRIIVESGKHTLIDRDSVRVFVEGDRSIGFNRNEQKARTVFRTEEIPAGTTIRIEYTAYYTGGASEGNVTVGTVDARYETPGGESQQKSFTTENALENRPEAVIGNLEQKLNRGSQLSTAQEYLSYLGVLAIIYIVIRIGTAVVGGDDDTDPY